MATLARPPTLIDLTHTLSSDVTPIYPGDPSYSCLPHATVERDGYSVQAVSFGTHTGTHIDAPSHFITCGSTIESLPLTLLVNTPLVIDVTHKGPREKIVWSDLAAHEASMRAGVVLLLWTGWDRYWGEKEYFAHPFLERDAVERVLARGVKTIGVDVLSPDETGGESGDFGVHETVLGAGGVIAENLTNLGKLYRQSKERQTQATVFLLPLKIGGGDGAPVRAFATVY